ncbi:Cytoplasmic dynein 2 light intermediate chain 1 [Hondaea fermentalgiana]|uniref:Cytoplasmic dynein 2 light intermediate chain 1 n=1 Tax=Hondaea fermentalgiana TaxID=2315210 RepID=A0A2R5GT21_9STRA|nr:Cytoplasmic dynein 2 light intermediate chain 1 [Hondaea fermentalgiana]|eukprot:GBG31531.1 Cytoplasmic dynein 2 light intermediate chain 1 [Hondaea fermentalgiana]
MAREASISGNSSGGKSKTPDIFAHIERLEAQLAKASTTANEEPKTKTPDANNTLNEPSAPRDEEKVQDKAIEGKEETTTSATPESEPHNQAQENNNGGVDDNNDAANTTHKLTDLLVNMNEITPRNSWMLFVGPREAGKSSLIAQFLTPGKADEKPKPTVALEYTYGRRSNTSGERKDLCQIWELGGGDKLLDLASIVLAQKEPGLVVVCVDLSAPEEAFDEATKWMTAIRKRSRRVPIMLVGSKHDRFENEDGLKRKALAQALRYAACVHRAGLIFISKKDKTTLNYYRAILNHYAFATEKKRSLYVDPAKPIVIAPGRDSQSKIGLPPGVADDAPQATVEAAWRDLLQDYFPRARSSTRETKDLEADDIDTGASEDREEDQDEALNLEPEAVVDAHRQLKDKELQRYRARTASSAAKPAAAAASTRSRRSKGIKA